MRVARLIIVIAICVGLLASACGVIGGVAPRTTEPAPAGASQSATPAGKPSVLVRDLSVPWAIAFLPGGDALVSERDIARLLRVTPDGGVSTVGTVPGVEPYGEGGL